MKKHACIFSVFFLLLGFILLHSGSVHAASEPFAICKTPSGTVIEQGTPFALEFTVYRTYNREKLHVELYYGSSYNGNSIIASSTPSYSSYDSSIINQTINLDISGYAPGEYTVKYYMEYFTLGSWHTGSAYTSKLTITSSKYGSFPATQDGFTKATAFTPELDKDYMKAWTAANDNDVCLNKVEVPENGMVTLTMSAPRTSNGNNGKVELLVYADDGTVVGGARLGYPENALQDTYNYKVYLGKGTYYFDFKASFNVTSGVISSVYSFSFEKKEDIELESNNSRASATKLIKGKSALAFFGTDYSYDVDEDDWFQFDVQKGETISFWIDNFLTLDETTAIFKFQAPGESDNSLSKDDELIYKEKDIYQYTFTAVQSGTCYFHLYNYSKESIPYAVGYTTEPSKEELEAKANQAAADTVTEKLNALPTNAGMADEATVASARAAYNALTDAQKALVSSAAKNKLAAAESQIAAEKKAAAEAEAARKAAEAEEARKAAEAEEAKKAAESKAAVEAAESSDKSSAKNVEASILKNKNSDSDAADSTFGKLKATVKKVKNNQLTVSWAKVSGAKKYIIYGNTCGKKNKMRKLSESTGKSLVLKKLKKGTYYKFLVIATKTVDGYDQVIAKSKVVHAATTGGKVTNPKKVTVDAKKATIKKGKSYTIKAKLVSADTKLALKKHRALSFESSNTKIATVSKKGVVKGVAKGTATIYVYAQNGVYATVKVTVK